MATVTRVLDDAYFEVDGVDWSEQTTDLEITFEVADEDVTTYVDEGWTRVKGTRKTGKISAGILVDAVKDAYMWTNMGESKPFKFRAFAGEAVSSTNPQYAGNVMIPGFSPMSGKVSDVHRSKLDFKMDGKPERTTEPDES